MYDLIASERLVSLAWHKDSLKAVRGDFMFFQMLIKLSFEPASVILDNTNYIF